MPAPPAFALKNASLKFGGHTVLNDVSLTLDAGETLCVLGPSGSGKSSILRVLAGLQPLTSGALELRGQPADANGVFVAPEKRQIGFVFQDLALFPHLNVEENAGFGLRHMSKPERAERIASLLARFGLAGHARAWPSTLSGGEQQRLAVIRALAPRPRLMLLDEPFSGLDESLRQTIRAETLSALRAEGAAIVLVTHEPDEALASGRRIALMRAGRLIQCGTPQQLLDEPADPQVMAAFGRVNLFDVSVLGGVAQTPFGPMQAAMPEGRALMAVRSEDLILAEQDGAEALGLSAVRLPSGQQAVARLAGQEISLLLPHQTHVVNAALRLSVRPGAARFFPAH